VDVPFLLMESEIRQVSVPPDPDSWGIVSTIRGSKAPGDNVRPVKEKFQELVDLR
jgi:hypothetical protein